MHQHAGTWAWDIAGADCPACLAAWAQEDEREQWAALSVSERIGCRWNAARNRIADLGRRDLFRPSLGRYRPGEDSRVHQRSVCPF